MAINASALADWSATLDQSVALRIDDSGTEKVETTFQPRWDLDVGDSLSLTAIGRFRFDTEDELGYQGGHDHGDAELREAYADSEWGDAYWRIGKQQVVWGQADGLRVLDRVNPLDYREFILPEFEDRRVPLWMVNIDMPLTPTWSAQLLWIPDQSYDEFPEPGSPYVFSSPKFIPTPPPGVPVVLASSDRPQRRIKDSDFGMRFTAFLDGWDVSLNYLYHYQDQAVPFQQLDGGVLTITPTYKRTHLAGGSISNTFGSFTLRSEIGFSSDRYFLADLAADSDGVARTGELSYVVGFDYQGWRDWLISAQIFQSILTDPGRDIVRETADTTATLLVRRYFMNDSVRAEGLLIQSLTDNDGLLQAFLEYEWRSNIVIRFGADVFFGASAGLFGQFDNNDRVTLGLEFGF